MTRGHRGWLILQCEALSSSSPCRFIPAHYMPAQLPPAPSGRGDEMSVPPNQRPSCSTSCSPAPAPSRAVHGRHRLHPRPGRQRRQPGQRALARRGALADHHLAPAPRRRGLLVGAAGPRRGSHLPGRDGRRLGRERAGLGAPQAADLRPDRDLRRWRHRACRGHAWGQGASAPDLAAAASSPTTRRRSTGSPSPRCPNPTRATTRTAWPSCTTATLAPTQAPRVCWRWRTSPLSMTSTP